MERIARRFGGPRVLALPLLRLLAIVAGLVWVLLAPEAHHGWAAVHTILLGFVLYSAALVVALWRRPGSMLRLNAWVLAVDLVFALLLIRVTGGAQSTLFLALLLIAGVQSYYYGMARGVAAASASALAYLVVVWPTIGAEEWANIAVRFLMLIGTAVGVGILAQVEESERLAVGELTTAAQTREQFIASVVESLSEGLVALDLEGRVVTCNRALEERYGLAPRELLGRSVFEGLPNAQGGPLAESLRRLIRGEITRFSLEALEHDTPQRGRLVENVKGSLLRQHGRPAGAVLLIEDITERVALERTTRQSEKLAALGTLAAGIAHELNNPIGVISSRIEIMLLDAQSNALPDGVSDDLGVLHRHAQRVARIAQGLLSFARQAPIERGRVDLNALVEDTLLLLEGSVSKREIAIRRTLAPGLPAVWGDANALQQVLLNLLTNARDALEDGGEIVVQTEVPAGQPDMARLVVRDSGPGIAPDVVGRIFDPFFTTKAGGTGLGLSISYGIVREHRGSLDVESRPGEGTTFVVTLPAAGVDVPA